jgi:hypothetical protein
VSAPHQRLAELLAHGRELSPGTRSELVSEMRLSGCLACRTARTTERYWFSAYENETHSDPELRERVVDAFGFCPGHTCHLGLAEPWLRVARARVGQLSFALDECQRKDGWDARWEVQADMAARPSAPRLLDGEVLPTSDSTNPRAQTSGSWGLDVSYAAGNPSPVRSAPGREDRPRRQSQDPRRRARRSLRARRTHVRRHWSTPPHRRHTARAGVGEKWVAGQGNYKDRAGAGGS